MPCVLTIGKNPIVWGNLAILYFCFSSGNDCFLLDGIYKCLLEANHHLPITLPFHARCVETGVLKVCLCPACSASLPLTICELICLVTNGISASEWSSVWQTLENGIKCSSCSGGFLCCGLLCRGRSSLSLPGPLVQPPQHPLPRRVSLAGAHDSPAFALTRVHPHLVRGGGGVPAQVNEVTLYADKCALVFSLATR